MKARILASVCEEVTQCFELKVKRGHDMYIACVLAKKIIILHMSSHVSNSWRAKYNLFQSRSSPFKL